MPVKSLKPGEIPESVLGDLKTLMPDKFEYVAVGRNIYQLYPLPALKLLELAAKFIEALRDLRERLLAKLKEELPEEDFKNVVAGGFFITYTDMIADEKTRNVLIQIAQEALEGADENDIANMTAGQLADLLNKILKINLETIPESIRNQLFGMVPPAQEVQNKGGNGEDAAKNP